MKTKTTITELTQKDLSNFFSAVFEGVSWASFEEPEELKESAVNGWIAERLAKWLLLDKTNYIVFKDIEDNFKHLRTLSDVEEGWEKAFNAYPELFSKYKEENDMDFQDANIIFQYIMFGEMIY